MTGDQNNPESGNTRRKSVRSFVRREGRVTRGQERALAELLPRFELAAPPAALDLPAIFGHVAPTVLEIGFGNGDALAQMAACHPEKNFVGVEVHRPGVGHLLLAIESQKLGNVRISNSDAVEVLRDQIEPGALSRVNIFFPDPWPKKRHHKRRLIQPVFLELLASRLEAGGMLHLATDWQPYAAHMLEVLSTSPRFFNVIQDKPDTNLDDDARLESACVARPEERPLTKFERRGQRKGHGVWDLQFVTGDPTPAQ